MIHRTVHRTLIALMLWGLLASGPLDARPQDPASPSPPTELGKFEAGLDGFMKMLERTAEPLPRVTMASPDGFFEASLPAKAVQPIQRIERIYLLTLEFGPGPENFAECYVYRDELDVAGSLMSVSKRLFQISEQQNGGKITAKTIHGIDAGHVGSIPFLTLGWLFRIEEAQGGNSIVGQIKAAMASKEGHSLFCQTETIGYDGAFFELFRSLVDTVEFSGDPPPEPHYHEISKIHVSGLNLGFVHITHTMDKDGDIAIRHHETMLLPVDQQNLLATDSMKISYSTVAGDVISTSKVGAHNGALVHQLRLSRQDDGTWGVRGSVQGQGFEANLGNKPLRSPFGQRLEYRDFTRTAEVGAKLTFDDWLPDVAPGTFSERVLVHRGPDAAGAQVDLSMGGLSFATVLDATMTRRKATMPLSSQTVHFELLHTEGDVFYPLTLSPPAPSEEPAGNAPDSSQ